MSRCALCKARPDIGRLCYRHFDALADMLDPNNEGSKHNPERPDDARRLPSIPALFGWLDAQHGQSGEPDHSGVFRSSPPGRLQVMALRDPRSRTDGRGPDDHDEAPPLPVPRVLTDLVARVDRKDIDGQLEARPARTVEAACGWLHARREWLAEQEWVRDTCDVVKALHGQLRGAWGDPAMAPVGTCRKLVTDEGRLMDDGPWRCAWPLYLPEQPPKAPDEPVQLPSLRCSSCGWIYTGPELVQLGRDREQALRAMQDTTREEAS